MTLAAFVVADRPEIKTDTRMQDLPDRRRSEARVRARKR